MYKNYQNKLLEILGWIVCLLSISACFSSNSNTSNSQRKDTLFQNLDSLKLNKEDSLSPKNLKALSNYSDTLILKRFSSEIENFEKDDSLNPNRKTDIIFTGSSSIRKWTSLQNDMKELKVLNRGFGGSTIPEVIYYSDILVFKHHPQKIVFYAGENDIATTVTDSLKVYNSFVYFQKLVEQKLPKTRTYFISIKLSPVRSQYWNKIKATNKMIEQFCKLTASCTFIDINKAMLDKNGKVRKDIFVEDNLHLNKEGYKIWTEIIYRTLKMQNK